MKQVGRLLAQMADGSGVLALGSRAQDVVDAVCLNLDLQNDCMMRGVTKPQKLTLVLRGDGTGEGEVNETRYFDRRDYGIAKKFPLLGSCLLFSEIANQRHLETLTVEGVDHHNEPENEEPETHHGPQKQIH